MNGLFPAVCHLWERISVENIWSSCVKILCDHVRYCHLIYCLDKIFTFKPFLGFHIFECKHKCVTGISFLVAYDLSQLSYTSSDVPGWISHFCDIPLLHMRYCSYSLLWSPFKNTLLDQGPHFGLWRTGLGYSNPLCHKLGNGSY